MRTRLLCCIAALSTAACIKRVSPTPPDERRAFTGVPLPFVEPSGIPEGSQVLWDFGDGTPPAVGARVTHAFGKAGVYTIVETIRDKDGQSRTARTHVVAALRTLPMAVPGDVRAALFFPAPWARMELHRDIAAKLALSGFFDELTRAVSDAAGFDALDPKAVEANGFDAGKGVAFFTVPQDPEALVLAVGTVDDARSLQAARKLLGSAHPAGRSSSGSFQLRDAQLPDGSPILLGQNAGGDRVAVMQRYGYLYLRTAGQSDPLLSLRSTAALAPDKGLSADPGFLGAARHVGFGDAVFYSRASDSAGGLRYSAQLASSAFAVLEKSEVLQIRVFSQLRNLKGEALAAAFKPLRDPPDLAARLPAGASGYLRLSAAPEALWRELSRLSGADAARLRDRVQESTGLDLEKDLIPSFSGNVGIAVYLDASSLIEAIMGEEVGTFDKSAFVVAAQLTNTGNVRAVLERAMKTRPEGDRAQLSGASVFRLGDAAVAAIKDDLLFLELGGLPPPPPAEPPRKRGRKTAPEPRRLALADLGTLARVLQPPERTLSLGQELKRIGIAGFGVPGQENLWVNIASIVRGLERAGAAQGGVASSAARLFADRAAALRDVLFEARPGTDGVDADFWIRFLPGKAQPGGAK